MRFIVTTTCWIIFATSSAHQQSEDGVTIEQCALTMNQAHAKIAGALEYAKETRDRTDAAEVLQLSCSNLYMAQRMCLQNIVRAMNAEPSDQVECRRQCLQHAQTLTKKPVTSVRFSRNERIFGGGELFNCACTLMLAIAVNNNEERKYMLVISLLLQLGAQTELRSYVPCFYLGKYGIKDKRSVNEKKKSLLVTALSCAEGQSFPMLLSYMPQKKIEDFFGNSHPARYLMKEKHLKDEHTHYLLRDVVKVNYPADADSGAMASHYIAELTKDNASRGFLNTVAGKSNFCLKTLCAIIKYHHNYQSLFEARAVLQRSEESDDDDDERWGLPNDFVSEATSIINEALCAEHDALCVHVHTGIVAQIGAFDKEVTKIIADYVADWPEREALPLPEPQPLSNVSPTLSVNKKKRCSCVVS